MNDPNGLMYFNGIYHMFYQYNPKAAFNENQYNVWGHAVSKDLIHWEVLPYALNPTNTYDINGCWTGSATIVNGVPTLIYTGINSQGVGTGESQCTATPTDLNDPLLVNWTKTASNPVIPGPPVPNTSGFRDPTTAWKAPNGNTWYIELGSGDSSSGFTLLYQSTDFLHWTYVHPLFNASSFFAGSMFECPDFYNIIGNTYVYKVSIYAVQGLDMWLTGTFDAENLVFVPNANKEGCYDFGSFYASKSFRDPVGNRQIVFGWSVEDDSQSSYVARGWAGVQTLPRQVTLNSDLTLSQSPIADLHKLRGKAYSFPNLNIHDEEVSLNLTQGFQLEIEVKINAVNETPIFGLKVRASPDSEEFTRIYFVPPTPYVFNQDLPGNDFKGIDISTTDPGLCSEMCTQNEQCTSWAYAPPGDQGPSAMCFLKRFVPDMKAKYGTVSGIKGLITVDRSNSTLATDANKGVQIAPLSSAPQTLAIFIDHSIIEVFANGGRSNIVSRIYPTLNTSQEVIVFVEGGSVSLDINIWDISSI